MRTSCIRRRQGIGFSPEIETIDHYGYHAERLHVARGLASRLRLKHGEIVFLSALDAVARGLASRLRLKLTVGTCCVCFFGCRQGIGFSPEIETQYQQTGQGQRIRRQGIGFSPEIETVKTRGARYAQCRRQGIGFSPEIETLDTQCVTGLSIASPGDWLLA